ncbi:MAG: hypothetical protein M0Z48_00950 [Nitrospiraceae bacterium]|nr:hypothetical protein [Nitrospiraceae bacterium]
MANKDVFAFLRKNLKRFLLIFLLCTAIFAARHFPHAVSTEIQGSQLPGNTGEISGNARIAVEGRDKGGALTYGPYVKLSPGEYKVTLEYSATSGGSGLWDMVFQGATSVLKSGKLPSGNKGVLSETLKISRENAGKPLEIRLWYTGKGTLEVAKMKISRRLDYHVLLSLSEGLATGVFILFLLYLLSLPPASHEPPRHEFKVNKIAFFAVLIATLAVIYYPFNVGKGIFEIYRDLGIISLYIFFLGLGFYFLLTPDVLRDAFLFPFLVMAYGLMELSIISVFTVHLNVPVVNGLPISLIISGIMLALALLFKRRMILFELGKLKDSKGKVFSMLLIGILLTLIGLSPIMRSSLPTTPYRLDIDQAGYAEVGQYLLEGGTVKQTESDILRQTGATDLDKAILNNDAALKFNTAIDAQNLLKALRSGYPAINAIFAYMTGSDHIYKVQFLALAINYVLLFGIILFVFYRLFFLREGESLLFSFAVVMNSNLINVYYEGMGPQFFFMPFLVILAAGYCHLRRQSASNNPPSQMKQQPLRQYLLPVLFLAFIFAGAMNIYNDGILIFAAFLFISFVFDIFLLKRINRNAPYMILAMCLGALLIFPHSFQFIRWYPKVLGKFIHIAGFWQPHWASPAEILGIFNIYVPRYVKDFPILLKRTEWNSFINVILSCLIVIPAANYIVRDKDIDASFWLAAPAFVLIIFFKVFFIDHINNYDYMKAYTIFIPLLAVLILAAFDHFSGSSARKLWDLGKIILVVAIIFSGVQYINQYDRESRTVTKDMFNLYEYNKKNDNILDSYAFITNKGTMDEFMIIPLIPFRWLNQGADKNPRPDIMKKVALLIQKKDFADPSIFNRYRRHVVYENSSILIINTGKLLEESYDSKSNKCDLQYYKKGYGELF